MCAVDACSSLDRVRRCVAVEGFCSDRKVRAGRGEADVGLQCIFPERVRQLLLGGKVRVIRMFDS